jgi:hypothetical protein
MMLDFLLNFIPEWICLYKTPMSSKGWQMWEKTRELGSSLFIVLGTLILGSFPFVGQMLWNLPIRHRSIDSFDLIFNACWWFSGALVVMVVEWKLQESRFRLQPKADSSFWSK